MVRKWKIALGENGFWSCEISYGATYTLDEIFTHVKEMKYDGIELFPLYHNPLPENSKEIKKLKRLYEEQGLEIPAIQSAPGGSLADPDDNKRREYVNNLKKQVRFAAEIDATFSIALYPGPIPPGITPQKALQVLIDSYCDVVEEAEKLNVTLNMETEPPFIVNTPIKTKEVLDRINSKNFKVLWDFSHVNVISNGDPIGFLKFIGGRVGWTHVTDNDGSRRYFTAIGAKTSTHLPLGWGELDYRNIIRSLIEYGYAGWWQVDLWEYPEPFLASRINKKELDQILNDLLA
jgi:sugar phosphate isomerase/epimerase